jgi:hypothetical protein
MPAAFFASGVPQQYCEAWIASRRAAAIVFAKCSWSVARHRIGVLMAGEAQPDRAGGIVASGLIETCER